MPRFALLLALLPLVAIAASGRPLASSKEFGQRLVAEFDVPDEIVEKYRSFKQAPPNKKMSALENTLLADTVDWNSDAIALDSHKNPYTVVVTLTGTPTADGNVNTMWMAGWKLPDGVSRLNPMTGLMKRNAKAGEPLTITAGSAATSFREDSQSGVALSLIKADNFHIDSAHVQVWSGLPATSAMDFLHGFHLLWIGLVMFVFWWFLLRKS